MEIKMKKLMIMLDYKTKRYSVLWFSMLMVTAALAERPENELPEYGGQHERTLATNPEHSKGLAGLGWKYFYKGDLDTAIKRFNQAWLFDEKNYQAYWGFGIICGKRAVAEEDSEHNIKDSIKHLKKAISLTTPNPKLLTDLGYSQTNFAALLDGQNKKADAEKELEEAARIFQEAEKLDSNCPLLFENWSYALFYLGNYQEAKAKMDRATSLGIKFSDDYVKDLLQQLGKVQSDIPSHSDSHRDQPKSPGKK